MQVNPRITKPALGRSIHRFLTSTLRAKFVNSPHVLTSGIVVAEAEATFLLMETGDFLLQENGDKLRLEA
jgi:hypothetical protein